VGGNRRSFTFERARGYQESVQKGHQSKENNCLTCLLFVFSPNYTEHTLREAFSQVNGGVMGTAHVRHRTGAKRLILGHPCTRALETLPATREALYFLSNWVGWSFL